MSGPDQSPGDPLTPSEQAASVIAAHQDARHAPRPSRTLYDVLVVLTVLAVSVVIILAFAVIIARQHTIDSLRTQIDSESELTSCAAKLTDDVNAAQQQANGALDDLMIVIAGHVVDAPVDARQVQAAIEQLHVKSDLADAAVRRRSEWLIAGAPLPCPNGGP